MRGFTLTELCVGLAILGVVFATAAPSFAALVRETRVRTVTSDLLAALYRARSEAVKRNRRVTVCASADQAQCASGLGWARGLILFEDGNDNARRDGGEAVLYAAEWNLVGVGVGASRPLSDYVSYVSTGESRQLGGALQMGTFTICGGGAARLIVVSASGRPRLASGGPC